MILDPTRMSNDGQLVDEGLRFLNMGLSIIGVGKDKKPLGKWKHRQTQRATAEELRKELTKPGTTGIAVVLGSVSGDLVCRDFDTEQGYAIWSSQFRDLADGLPTARTHRGFHVYFRAVECAPKVLGEAGELRANGQYVVMPPSQHPKGDRYEWISPLPPTVEAIAELDPELCGLLGDDRALTEWHEKPEQQSHGDNRVPRDTQKDLETETKRRLVSAPSSLSVSVSCDDPRIQGAIDTTLPEKPGQREYRLFEFLRALKAIPELEDAHPKQLRPVSEAWHKKALPCIGTKPFDETWAYIIRIWPKVKYPLGKGPLDGIADKARRNPVNANDYPYEDERVLFLLALCRELQREAKDKPLHIGCRQVAYLLGIDRNTASAFLKMLCFDGFLAIIEPAKPRRNTRYQFSGPMN